MTFEAPPNLKGIQPYLKIAAEHDQRDIVGKLTFFHFFLPILIFQVSKLLIDNL